VTVDDNAICLVFSGWPRYPCAWTVKAGSEHLFTLGPGETIRGGRLTRNLDTLERSSVSVPVDDNARFDGLAFSAGPRYPCAWAVDPGSEQFLYAWARGDPSGGGRLTIHLQYTHPSKKEKAGRGRKSVPSAGHTLKVRGRPGIFPRRPRARAHPAAAGRHCRPTHGLILRGLQVWSRGSRAFFKEN
jgi:hypothetical protein